MFSFHHTHIFYVQKGKHIACQKCKYLKFNDLRFMDFGQSVKNLYSGVKNLYSVGVFSPKKIAQFVFLLFLCV